MFSEEVDNEAYYEGRLAREHGESREANPYSQGTDGHRRWYGGWLVGSPKTESNKI